MRKLMLAALALPVLALPTFGTPASAADTVKIGYIDPLSGGGASVGEGGLKTFQYLADEINAAGGILGQKVEIVPLDNKTNPQESLIQAQKAIDSGVRYVTQGNGSSVGGALSDFLTKYNERNPGKEVLYFNYAAVDPVLTNEKCSFWHFRWDANSDIKMAALTNYMKDQKDIKKVYLINQDYSFGESVRTTARKMLKEKRPDIEIVGVTGVDQRHRARRIGRCEIRLRDQCRQRQPGRQRDRCPSGLLRLQEEPRKDDAGGDQRPEREELLQPVADRAHAATCRSVA